MLHLEELYKCSVKQNVGPGGPFGGGGAVVNGFPSQASPHRPRIPEAPARGWLSEQSPAIKQDHKRKAGS